VRDVIDICSIFLKVNCNHPVGDAYAVHQLGEMVSGRPQDLAVAVQWSAHTT